MIKNFFVALFAVVFFTGSALADDVNGFCTQVVDANTLFVIAGGTQYTVRLGYIDAPELDQKFGNEAKKFVEELALKKNLKLTVIESGKDFMTAEVYSPKKQDPVNRLLVRQGLAWTKQDDDRYALALSFAKQRSLGIWSDPGIQRPEEYRAQKEQQLQKAKITQEKMREGRIMDLIVKKSDNKEKNEKQNRDTVEPREPAVAQQTDPYIETRPGYRAEDVESEAQRLRAEQQAKERQDACLQGFSSAHSGVGESSRAQREMDFNEWAIKCGVDPPYKSPNIVVVEKAGGNRHVNKDPYNLGRQKSDNGPYDSYKTSAGKNLSKPGPDLAKPSMESTQK